MPLKTLFFIFVQSWRYCHSLEMDLTVWNSEPWMMMDFLLDLTAFL